MAAPRSELMPAIALLLSTVIFLQLFLDMAYCYNNSQSRNASFESQAKTSLCDKQFHSLRNRTQLLCVQAGLAWTMITKRFYMVFKCTKRLSCFFSILFSFHFAFLLLFFPAVCFLLLFQFMSQTICLCLIAFTE